jgi:hypothetical protein
MNVSTSPRTNPVTAMLTTRRLKPDVGAVPASLSPVLNQFPLRTATFAVGIALLMREQLGTVRKRACTKNHGTIPADVVPGHDHDF